MASVRILNYDCCRLMWKSCRFPDKGKPLRVQGCRLFKEGDNFVLFRYNERIASIAPDSMFTLHVMPEGSLQWALHRIFNLRVHRYGRGKYRVGLQRTPMTDDDQLPKYFTNIRFDMFSHQCVNAAERPPDPVRVKDSAKELDWQRKLRTYVRGWKVRAKIGAIVHSIDAHFPKVYGKYDPLTPQTLVAIVESENYDQSAALIVREALNYWEARQVAEKGWENYIRERSTMWGYTPAQADISKMFERVYRRHREAVYNMLGISKLEQPVGLNPAL